MPPNVSTNCVQFDTSVGVFSGPFGAMPMNAATAVPTPSIGRVPGVDLLHVHTG